jgi:transposase
MEDTKPATRRRHDAELKRRVLAQCEEPGASVAKVALTNGLNANLVHRWRRLASAKSEPKPEISPRAFLPVALAAPPTTKAADIRIELRRGAISVNVTWPLAASSDCAAWLREILK